MDAQRTRRTRDQARKTWYAHYRQIRFARWFGFIGADTDLSLLFPRVLVADGVLGSAAQVRDETTDGPALVLGGAASRIS